MFLRGFGVGVSLKKRSKNLYPDLERARPLVRNKKGLTKIEEKVRASILKVDVEMLSRSIKSATAISKNGHIFKKSH